MNPVEPPERGEAAGSRPDPLDRLWRHPSELGTSTSSNSATAAPSRGLWPLIGLGAASAMFGSLLTVGILGLSGLLSGPPKPTIRDRLLTVANDDARNEAANAVRPAMVQINYRTAKGPARAAGFCVKQGGLILTSAVVTGKTGTITIVTAEGDTLSATLVGKDATSGLAVLQTTGEMPVASLASSPPKAGDSVIVIGSDAAIGEGIVNSTGTVLVSNAGIALPNLLVTSALPHNNVPGSAVVDRRGKIAGIVVAGNVGAVPIDYAKNVIKYLTESSAPAHAWVGIHGKDSPLGPVITSVDPSSPAAIAGVKVGDVIRSIDDRAVLSMKDLQAMIRWRWARDEIVISLQRDRLPVSVTLTAMPAPQDATRRPVGPTTTTTGPATPTP